MSETAAFEPLGDDRFLATELTQGPWSPEHQHGGPPSALICRAVERAAAPHGLAHIGRLTVNLLRPAPIAEVRIEIAADGITRNSGHFSGKLWAGEKLIALFTALAQREHDLPVPEGTPGHPLPAPLRPPEDCPPARMGFGRDFGYARFTDNRLAAGAYFKGPSTVWFRLNHPLVAGEAASPYQIATVAADSGNGISAPLDFHKYTFVSCDLTINFLRRPEGAWVCLDAKSWLGGNACGVAESAIYDERGLIGRAAQSLAVRAR